VRTGIFGGTFDPVHIAHLRVAEEVAEKQKLDRVIFVPAGHPPHRRAPLAAAEHRLAMVRLGVAGNPRFAVSDCELKRTGPSYTVDTLAYFKSHFPQDRLFLLMGTDQLLELHRWHEVSRLLALAKVVAFSRPGLTLPTAKHILGPQGSPLSPRAYCVQTVSGLDISATVIRQRARQNESLRYLVPNSVERYLRMHGLYLRKRL
jgi:nicotinate-nucleotide adenylyltransferase